MLWPEDMPPHALVILSDADDLVPSPLVAKHISDAHTTATVMYHPTAGHGGFLVDLPWQRQMVQVGGRSLRHAHSPQCRRILCVACDDFLVLVNSRSGMAGQGGFLVDLPWQLQMVQRGGIPCDILIFLCVCFAPGMILHFAHSECSELIK